MTRKMKKPLRVPRGKLGAKSKRHIAQPGVVADDEGWSESSDGSWSDFTGEWMDFTKAARKATQVSTPARALRRNIKKR